MSLGTQVLSVCLSANYLFSFSLRQVPLEATQPGTTCFPVIFQQERHLPLFSESPSKDSLTSHWHKFLNRVLVREQLP